MWLLLTFLFRRGRRIVIFLPPQACHQGGSTIQLLFSAIQLWLLPLTVCGGEMNPPNCGCSTHHHCQIWGVLVLNAYKTCSLLLVISFVLDSMPTRPICSSHILPPLCLLPFSHRMASSWRRGSNEGGFLLQLHVLLAFWPLTWPHHLTTHSYSAQPHYHAA